MTPKWYWRLFLLAIGIFLAVFVWPTRFRYDRMKLNNSEIPVRIDRFSSRTEVLYPTGWQEIKGPSVSRSGQRASLPPEAAAKVSGECSMTSYDEYLNCEIYNGSSWTIRTISVSVSVFDAQGVSILSREYALTCGIGVDVSPKSSAKCFAQMGFTLQGKQTWTYTMRDLDGFTDSIRK